LKTFEGNHGLNFNLNIPDMRTRSAFVIFSRYFFAVVFIAGGIYHFVNPGFYLKFMPGFIPFPFFMILVSGFLEILGGLGLLFKITRKYAALLVILLLISFFPVHIDHILKGGQINQEISIPPAATWLRLAFQFVMIFWTWKIR
jgi:uncharacterized membrane protein